MKFSDNAGNALINIAHEVYEISDTFNFAVKDVVIKADFDVRMIALILKNIIHTINHQVP